MSDTNSIEARKQAAVQFLQLIVMGHIDEAYEKYVDMQGTHHNPLFPAGFPELRKAMIENHVQFPNKKLTTKNVLGDGDLLLCTPTSCRVRVRQAYPLCTYFASKITRL